MGLNVKKLDMRIGKMIEIEKQYKLTLTEQQATELYHLLRLVKDVGDFCIDGRFPELRTLYNELKELSEML